MKTGDSLHKQMKARGATRFMRVLSPCCAASLAALLLFFSLLVPAHASTPDPCASINQRNSVSIAVSSATTTSLVSVVAGRAIYVCGFALTIAGSATAATTAQFEYGTGAACSSPTVLTGTMGAGTATATVPIQVSYGGDGGTIMIVPPSSGLCIVTAGTTVLTEGVVTYVQGSGIP